jgi:hypothetical protein
MFKVGKEYISPSGTIRKCISVHGDYAWMLGMGVPFSVSWEGDGKYWREKPECIRSKRFVQYRPDNKDIPVQTSQNKEFWGGELIGEITFVIDPVTKTFKCEEIVNYNKT